MQWFDVDKAGLAKLLEERGAAFAVLELVQNALDTEADEVVIDLNKVDDGVYALRVVDNDPTGFSNLAHAFTLFAESEKKGNALKRGRFNLGEKLVLALCDSAAITSTKGTIHFAAEGRTESRIKTERGSVIDLTIRLTDEDADEVERLIKTVLFPEGVKVLFNGDVLQARTAVRVVKASLPTVAARDNGTLFNTSRKTEVRLVQPQPGEKPHLYELGIPVVEIDLPFHADVQQKVPVGFNRDSVNPSYARALYVAIVNEASDLVAKGDTASRSWAADALADPKISADAVRAIIEAKYGVDADKLVRFDPSDPQSKTEAQSLGLDVIGGRAFTPEQWDNINKAGLLPAAGKVAPSRNSVLHPSTEEEAEVVTLEFSDLTDAQRDAVQYTVEFATYLLGRDVTVKVVKDDRAYLASWSGRTLTYNAKRISKGTWTNQSSLDATIIHEVSHSKASDHLDHRFYEACCTFGAKARTYGGSLAQFAALRTGITAD